MINYINLLPLLLSNPTVIKLVLFNIPEGIWKLNLHNLTKSCRKAILIKDSRWMDPLIHNNMQMAQLPLTEQRADKKTSQMAQKKRQWKDIGGNRSGKSNLCILLESTQKIFTAIPPILNNFFYPALFKPCNILNTLSIFYALVNMK